MSRTLIEAFWRLRHRLKPEQPGPWHATVRAAGLYPAYADWMGAFAVDANGTVWFAPHPADWAQRERVHEPELMHVARIQAARWSPELLRHVPVRGPDAELCPSCHGTGRPRVSARYWGQLICECGGTGWVPPGWRSNHTSAGRWAEKGLDQPPV